MPSTVFSQVLKRMQSAPESKAEQDRKILGELYRNFPVVAIRVRANGTILSIDGNLDRISLDQSKIEIGKNIFHVNPETKFYIEKVTATGDTIHFRMQFRDGSVDSPIRQVWESTAFLDISANDHRGEQEVVVLAWEVTSTETLREELYAKNQELQAIFDAIPDMYFRLDLEGTVLDYKTASVSEHYIPADQFLNKPFMDFLPQNLSKRVIYAIHQVNRQKQLVTMEYFIPMGVTSRHFEARFFPLLSQEIIVIIREITDRVLSQEKIFEKEKLLLETQKIAKVFSFFWDINDNRLTWTDEFYRMVGVSPDKIEHSPDGFLEFVHPEDRDRVMEAMHTSVRTKKKFHVEYRFLLNQGKIISLLSEGQVKCDRNGNPIKMLGLTQDITQRKGYELELLTQKQELQTLLDNIEGIVSHQTTEVVLAKEKAETANQAKTQFLANISHELKTPIHAIMSFAELGKEKSQKMDRSKIEEYFAIIHDSAKRLYDLMANILDLTKIDSGKENFDFQTYEMHSVIASLLQEMNAVLAKKRIHLVYNKPGFKAIVEMDNSRITQVLRNLLTNAIKFSPEGSSIEISILRGEFQFPNRAKPEVGIGVKVRDYGKGIPADEKELIFERFEQGSKVRAGTGGTGLGLTISREIILAHGGVIFADNHAQGGAEFVFFIPVRQKAKRGRL